MSITTPDSDQILTPSRVHVYFGEVGTEAPQAPTGPFTGWKYAGHTTPDSMSFETSPQFEDFNSGQSDYPVKKIQTADGATAQVDLAQWNAENIKAVHGGGTITTVGSESNVYKYVPPRIGQRKDIACLFHVQEGGKNYLWVMPRVSQSEGVSHSLQKGTTSTLPLRLTVMGSDGTDAWYLLSDDPALAAA